MVGLYLLNKYTRVRFLNNFRGTLSSVLFPPNSHRMARESVLFPNIVCFIAMARQVFDRTVYSRTYLYVRHFQGADDHCMFLSSRVCTVSNDVGLWNLLPKIVPNWKKKKKLILSFDFQYKQSRKEVRVGNRTSCLGQVLFRNL